MTVATGMLQLGLHALWQLSLTHCLYLICAAGIVVYGLWLNDAIVLVHHLFWFCIASAQFVNPDISIEEWLLMSLRQIRE